jgi:hypothetical protein
MPRPQFTIRALLVAMLVVAAFFGVVRFERDRQWHRENDEPWFWSWIDPLPCIEQQEINQVPASQAPP